MNTPLFVKKITNEDIEPPSQAHLGDAGYDIRAAESFILYHRETKLIKTGYAFAIPFGWVGIIKDRSSIASKRRCEVAAGVIDSTYRGEVSVLIMNHDERPQFFNKGDKIAQIVIMPCYISKVNVVDQLSETIRGEDGFGSTGIS